MFICITEEKYSSMQGILLGKMKIMFGCINYNFITIHFLWLITFNMCAAVINSTNNTFGRNKLSVESQTFGILNLTSEFERNVSSTTGTLFVEPTQHTDNTPQNSTKRRGI